MGKKIIVAGGGHGGIALGMLLAKNGYDVTVYEKNTRRNMGYDWTDVFNKNAFHDIGLPVPDESLFVYKPRMSFYSTGLETVLRENLPEEEAEIVMERKALYKYIIDEAEKAGVKFVFSCSVEEPILFGNRVVGIKTSKGAKYADLVVDACGIDSPLRRNLPSYFGIQHETDEYERFYVYRAFFDKVAETAEDDRYKVILLDDNKLGISWVASESKYADILIGRFEPFDEEEAERTVNHLRETNPCIGYKLKRGGQFVSIPVRQPLGLFVAEGYAAIGDSAFMTIPIIGSGIANSFTAARILFDVILDDEDEAYSAETLWKYQRRFFKKLGSNLAPLACVKLLLTYLDGEELDYIFKTGILNGDDMTNGVVSPNVATIVGGLMSRQALKSRLGGLAGNKALVSKILKRCADIVKAATVTAAIPKEYNRKAVLKWVEEYNECFERHD